MTAALVDSVGRTSGEEWFYSTLAEVSATIVGFLGAFLVLRLHTSMEEWRLESRHVEESRRVLTRLQERPDSGSTSQDQERVRAALDGLLATADRQRLARFPAELTVGAVILCGLLTVGVIGPLAALDAPEDAAQVAVLLPFAVLSMLAAGTMFFYAVRAWRTWQSMPLMAWHDQHARVVTDADRSPSPMPMPGRHTERGVDGPPTGA